MSKFPGLPSYMEEADILFDYRPWCILGIDKLAGYMKQVAIVGHKCDEFSILQLMDEEDALRGECWWCKQSIPEGVQFMWQMLNWQNLPKMRMYETDEEWTGLSPEKRYVKKFTQVSLATASTHGLRPVINRKNQTNVHKPQQLSRITKKYDTTKKKSMVWGPNGSLFIDKSDWTLKENDEDEK